MIAHRLLVYYVIHRRILFCAAPLLAWQPFGSSSSSSWCDLLPAGCTILVPNPQLAVPSVGASAGAAPVYLSIYLSV